TFAAARVDQAGGAWGIEFGAQSLDVDVDYVGEGVEAFVPDVMGDGFPADDPVLVKHHEFEQRVFLGGEIDGAAAAGDRMVCRIQRKIAGLHDVRTRD